MSEERKGVEDALVEALAAQKMIGEKLKKAQADLSKWEKRKEAASKKEDAFLEREIQGRIRPLQLTIAEYEAELMAQQDLEKELRKTLSRLKSSVPVSGPIKIPDDSAANETIDRLERKVMESEALAELSENRKEVDLNHKFKDAALNEELEALKRKMKEED